MSSNVALIYGMSHTLSYYFKYSWTELCSLNSPCNLIFILMFKDIQVIFGRNVDVNVVVVYFFTKGCLAPIDVIIPEGCLINPHSDAAVVGGNVLTSQRLVDVIFKAFETCAASQVTFRKYKLINLNNFLSVKNVFRKQFFKKYFTSRCLIFRVV